MTPKGVLKRGTIAGASVGASVGDRSVRRYKHSISAGRVVGREGRWESIGQWLCMPGDVLNDLVPRGACGLCRSQRCKHVAIQDSDRAHTAAAVMEDRLWRLKRRKVCIKNAMQCNAKSVLTWQ